jgi:hypothetical protein
VNSTPTSSPDLTLKPPSLAATIFWRAVSLAFGLAGGVFLHYLIYRLSLPTEPFIYVGF